MFEKKNLLSDWAGKLIKRNMDSYLQSRKGGGGGGGGGGGREREEGQQLFKLYMLCCKQVQGFQTNSSATGKILTGLSCQSIDWCINLANANIPPKAENPV